MNNCNENGLLVEYDDPVKDAVYLVSRGVRPLALIGKIQPEDAKEKWNIVRALNKVQYAVPGCIEAGTNVVPLAWRRTDGVVEIGVAARAWVADTLKWLEANAPQPHLDRLLGLLLGYSVDSIAIHDEISQGELY